MKLNRKNIKRKKNGQRITETMEPGGIEEESIADSDNQILQPLESNT